jgi:predicted nucleic acid-binding protein
LIAWEIIPICLDQWPSGSRSEDLEGTEKIFFAVLADRYQLSWFDSLIVSAGLEANATTLYSEDLNNSQVYENQMTVINPFK